MKSNLSSDWLGHLALFWAFFKLNQDPEIDRRLITKSIYSWKNMWREKNINITRPYCLDVSTNFHNKQKLKDMIVSRENLQFKAQYCAVSSAISLNTTFYNVYLFTFSWVFLILEKTIKITILATSFCQIRNQSEQHICFCFVRVFNFLRDDSDE